MDKRGMSKIEVLIVVLVIGILGLAAIIAVSSARSKTRDAVRLSDVRQMQAALELYFNDFNAYPEQTEAIPLGQASTRCLSENGFSASCTPSLETVYMEAVAATPRKGLKNVSKCGDINNAYCYVGQGYVYKVEFELENNNSLLGLTKGLNCATPAEITAGACQ